MRAAAAPPFLPTRVATLRHRCCVRLRGDIQYRPRQDGHVVADQLRAVDRERLVKRLGSLPETTLNELLGVLQAMFAA
jgi:mRNA-degrading endonuclease toxin of MazEF toxin-antitoxin module